MMEYFHKSTESGHLKSLIRPSARHLEVDWKAPRPWKLLKWKLTSHLVVAKSEKRKRRRGKVSSISCRNQNPAPKSAIEVESNMSFSSLTFSRATFSGFRYSQTRTKTFLVRFTLLDRFPHLRCTSVLHPGSP